MSTISYLVWAIPAIGFLGTVRGLAGGMSKAGNQKDADFIRQVTDQLGIAFDCTFVALALSVVLMGLLHAVQKAEELLIIDSQAYCQEHLLLRLYDPEPEPAYARQRLICTPTGDRHGLGELDAEVAGRERDRGPLGIDLNASRARAAHGRAGRTSRSPSTTRGPTWPRHLAGRSARPKSGPPPRRFPAGCRTPSAPATCRTCGNRRSGRPAGTSLTAETATALALDRLRAACRGTTESPSPCPRT